jgi:glycosyltransferase involved in cell wall biosynthesis
MDGEPRTNMDRRVVMIGPLPPPNGGVANFVRNIREVFSTGGLYELVVHQTGPGSPPPSPLVQLFQEVGRAGRFLPLAKKFDPNIAHIHTSIYYSILRNLPYMVWCRYLSECHLIIHVHSGQFEDYYHETNVVMKRVTRWMLREADAVVVTSPSWIEVVRRIVGREQAIYSLTNGFDHHTFRPADQVGARKVLGIPVEGRVLVAIGYLEQVKGHRHLIEAMASVRQDFDDVRLHIVGTGSLHENLVSRVNELGLDDRVFFHPGYQPSSTVAQWMNASDVFVLPSLSEGNPTVLVEALGCGRPFVGTRVGGVPDVVTSEELGVLCPPGDADALATAIVKALGKDWDSEKISTYAQRYSWTRIAGQLTAIYDKVMDTRNDEPDPPALIG